VTTNVIDLLTGASATDSRWSFEKDNFVIFIDDVGFEKIVSANGHAFTFAGNGVLIQGWKDWIEQRIGAKYPPVDPCVQGQPTVAVCIVEMQTRDVKESWGAAITSPEAIFAGSGAKRAKACWDVNKDSQRAVESAKSGDVFSGGSTKHLAFACGTNNVKEVARIEDVCSAMVTRGMVMYKNDGNVIPVQKAAANDPQVAEAVGMLRAGVAAPTAPCDSMLGSWTTEEKRQLHTVLHSIFPERF